MHEYAIGIYSATIPPSEEKKLNLKIKEMVFQLNVKHKDRNRACLLPFSSFLMHIANRAGNEYVKKFLENSKDRKDFFVFCIMAHYMYTKGIYVVNKDLMNGIYDEEILKTCPSDVFLRIPQYTIFVDLSESEGREFGAFFHISYTSWEDDAKPNLVIVLCNSERYNVSVLPIEKGVPFRNAASFVANEEMGKKLENPKSAHGIDIDYALPKALSALLYICSQEPDIESLEPSKETGKKTKPSKEENPFKLRPASKQKYWMVGENVAKTIRSFNDESDKIKRSGVIPHIRKAHWHGYWKGPRSSSEFILKWLAPIIVKGSKDD